MQEYTCTKCTQLIQRLLNNTQLKPLIMDKEIFANERVFFYCVQPESPPKAACQYYNAAYHHSAISIAEGLKELGVEFYSNINYWRISPDQDDYLFNYNPEVTLQDCSIVVISLPWFLRGQPFPQELFHFNRNYKVVYIDREDGLKTFSWSPKFRQFDLILKTHYCYGDWYPNNVKPWAFGLTNRILNVAKVNDLAFDKRKKSILFNFRMKKNPHTLRKKIYKKFVPKVSTVLSIDSTIEQLNKKPTIPLEKLLWEQTGKRHNNSYYKRLGQTQACACFGGYFVNSWPRDQGCYLSRLQERIIAKLGLETNRIVQWDSWRLWESFALGCATFHVDFEKYGLLLPIMPQNWHHYIGIDLKSINTTTQIIMENPELLKQIATQGQAWAIKNYSPVPVAKRFLNTVLSL